MKILKDCLIHRVRLCFYSDKINETLKNSINENFKNIIIINASLTSS